jgi:deoxyribodipyrimidine photo-lyase
MKKSLTIYWARRDFRLLDNPALFNAIEFQKTHNSDYVNLYILDDGILAGGPHPHIGYPRRKYLSKALSHFATSLHGMEIISGNYEILFAELSKQYHEVHVFVNEDIEPYSIHRDKTVSKLVTKLHSFTDQLTVSAGTVSGSGTVYSVFTPFKKNVWTQFINSQSLLAPKLLNPHSLVQLELLNIFHSAEYTQKELESVLWKLLDCPWVFEIGGESYNLDQLLTRPNYEEWYENETQALEVFNDYLTSGQLGQYKQNRDDLALDTVEKTVGKLHMSGKTSKMSVALKWGLVSARTLKNKILEHFGTLFYEPFDRGDNLGAQTYLSELIWREFYKYILLHRPEVLNLEYQEKFRNIQWVSGDEGKKRFLAWIKGETGYPVVDAAMKQIASLGWMHNRSRMIVASILTKNLGVDWRWGQEYFRAVLLDLDEASNNGGWQWGASTGSDSKPIRIFNPYLQAENYDKGNKYQLKWLPKDYDHISPPLVEHKFARDSAMKRYGLGGRDGAPRDY